MTIPPQSERLLYNIVKKLYLKKKKKKKTSIHSKDWKWDKSGGLGSTTLLSAPQCFGTLLLWVCKFYFCPSASLFSLLLSLWACVRERSFVFCVPCPNSFSWVKQGLGLFARAFLELKKWREEWRREVAQSCPTLCNPMDCSPPGSSVHGIFQAWILKWVAISLSRGSSWPRDETRVSCIVGRRFTIQATKEALSSINYTKYQPRMVCIFCLMGLWWACQRIPRCKRM